MLEMFYVQMRPCPVGFTLQSSKKSCYCDPWLNNDIYLSHRVIWMMKLYYVLLIVGYLLMSKMIHIHTMCRHNVRLITVCLIHHILICQILTMSVQQVWCSVRRV